MKRSPYLFTLLTAAVLLPAARANAQAQQSSVLNQPAPAGRPFNLVDALQLTSSQSDSTASLTLHFQDTSGYIKSKSLSQDFDGFGTGFSVTVSTPLSKSSNATTLTTLSGLATSTNVSLQWSGFYGSGFRPAGDAQEQDNCRDLYNRFAPAWIKGHPGSNIPAQKAASDYCETHELHDVGVPDDLRLKVEEQRVAIWRFGGSVTAGEEAHSFYDPTTLTKASQTKTPVQIGVYLTHIGATRDWSLTLQADYQQAFSDGTSKTLCPAGGTGVVTCTTGSFGPPKNIRTTLIAGEWRWFTHLNGLPPFGLAPQVTYSTSNRAWAIDIPVYLLSDGKDNLTGGLKLDWTSIGHRVVVGFFVSKAFSIGSFAKPAS